MGLGKANGNSGMEGRWLQAESEIHEFAEFRAVGTMATCPLLSCSLLDYAEDACPGIRA